MFQKYWRLRMHTFLYLPHRRMTVTLTVLQRLSMQTISPSSLREHLPLYPKPRAALASRALTARSDPSRRLRASYSPLHRSRTIAATMSHMTIGLKWRGRRT